MPHARLSRTGLLGLLIAALLAVPAGGAMVAVNSLILHADVGFRPHSLPRHRFAPIQLRGHVEIDAKGGGKPVALRQAIIDFDRDGRLSVGGLPTCPPERVAEASPDEARRACAGAIVGSGHIEALISLAGGPVTASSPLTIFNGPPVEGHPTVVLHARTTVPGTQTYAIVVPIERRPGPFRYRATLDLPPIAGGLGAISHLDVEIGRRYTAGGKRRSFVSARCRDSILEAHGRLSFEDGTVIDGSVEKFCRAK